MKKSLILIGIVFCCILSCCSQIEKKLGLEEDNIVEEVAEDVIKGRTGLDIDLTPDSKEK